MFRAIITLPDPSSGELVLVKKRIVVLHDETRAPQAVEFPFLLYSTYKGRRIRASDVLVDPAQHGLPVEDFDRQAVIDCRWVRTDRKDRVLGTAQLLGTLPQAVMDMIDTSVVIGLDIGGAMTP